MGGELQQNQINNYGQAQQNLLVNPSFEIWQRGAGAFTANNVFTADEWKIIVGLGATTAVNRITGTNLHGLYGVSVDNTFAGTQSWLGQGVEMFRELGGQTVTFSADVKCSVASCVKLALADYDGGSTGGTSGAYHTGSGNWERLTVTYTLRTGLSPLAGWPHNFGLLAYILFQGTASGILIDGASLVVGNFPQGIPFIPLNPADDMNRCQRFYEAGSSRYSAYAEIGAAAVDETIFATPKSAVPTISYSISSSTNHNPAIALFIIPTTHGARRYLQPSSNGMVVVTATWDAEVT